MTSRPDILSLAECFNSDRGNAKVAMTGAPRDRVTHTLQFNQKAVRPVAGRSHHARRHGDQK